MLSDCHMHTHFSTDSEALPEAMIRRAIELGLPAICITDHEDEDYLCEGETFHIDTPRYFEELTRLQDKYRSSIDVRIGVEIGMQPHLGPFYEKYTAAAPYDFIIGSVHCIKGMDPYFPVFFEGKADEEAYREALEETLKDIKATKEFHVLGHLDYVVRYGNHREKEYSYARYADLIDEILRTLIQDGRGLELNTGGLKYGLPFAHPCMDVLKRYRELGGEIITVGSDAHRPEHIAYDFDRAEEMLKECGFRYIAEFVKKLPNFRALL